MMKDTSAMTLRICKRSGIFINPNVLVPACVEKFEMRGVGVVLSANFIKA